MRRPGSAPRKIPAWAWARKGWLDGGRKGPRPAGGPRITPLWFYAWLRWKRNPSAIDPAHPHAPASHPLPPTHTHVKPKPTIDPLAAHIVYWCHLSLAYSGKMTYTENWTLRQRFFARAIGKFLGASADCSQFVSTILGPWCGVKGLTSTDFTGSLLQKGRSATGPAPGRVAIWGPGTGAHTAFITEKVGNSDWYCVGFGHQGAPDRNTLSGMNAYFRSIGQPGVRYREFSA